MLKTITIESVLGGISPSQYFGSKGQYMAGIGIDPDLPISDSDVRLSGYIRPSAMEKFSGSTITAAPLWLITNPKDTNTYCYDSSGKIYSIDSSLTVSALNSGTALTASIGNGGEYYDNYIYFRKNADVARYGPLNGSPSLTQTYWTSTLSKTALTSAAYPSIRGVQIPNGHMHRHTDNKLYMCDVTSANKGVLHYIATSKTTVEGDTNNGSSYQALDFGYGYYPVVGESYGTDLAVALIEGVSTGSKQKSAALSFWDTTSSSFSKLIQVEFPDPLITAMKNVNGVLYVWSGYATGGTRLSRFIGGYSFEELWFDETMYPPLQGAVDAEMNRVIWGTATTYPDITASVIARGSRSAQLGNGIHNILKTTSAGTTPYVTALKYVQTTTNNFREPIVGWKDDSSQGIDKRSTSTYGTSVFRSGVQRIGIPFQVRKIRIPLAQIVASGQSCTVTIYTDNGSTSKVVSTINSTNYTQSQRMIEINPSGDTAIGGHTDFFIELRFTGTVLMTVTLPLSITIETTEQDE